MFVEFEWTKLLVCLRIFTPFINIVAILLMSIIFFVMDTCLGQAQQCQWYQLYDDITGAICRSEKVAGTFEEVIII